MKIAILGSAPSSLRLAPVGDPSWKIWGCSPGVFPYCGSPQAWFELHRWEPPVIGNAGKQVQWFSPEYVQWMAMRDPATCPVWMAAPVPEIAASRALPINGLMAKYGTYFFTSSISIMMACAIEDILEARAAGDNGEHTIGLWGIDMAATEEYGYQRAGCQYFITLIHALGIKIQVPAESDLLRPMPIYGISESSWWMIKGTARKRELEGRLAAAQQAFEGAKQHMHFMQGAVDDHSYHMQTWGEDRDGFGTHPEIFAKSPAISAAVLALQPPKPDEPPAAIAGLQVQELASSMQQNADRLAALPDPLRKVVTRKKKATKKKR